MPSLRTAEWVQRAPQGAHAGQYQVRYDAPTGWMVPATGPVSGPVTITYGYPNGGSQTVTASAITWADTGATWQCTNSSSPTSSTPEQVEEYNQRLQAAQEEQRRAAEAYRVQRRAQEEARIQQRREYEERLRAAQARAQVLLRRHLSDEQRAMYDEGRYFDVVVGERTYRLTERREGNVFLMVDERPVVSYCIHPDEYLPPADQQLTQLLWLETQERRFLEVAVASRMAHVDIPPALCDQEVVEQQEQQEEEGEAA